MKKALLEAMYLQATAIKSGLSLPTMVANEVIQMLPTTEGRRVFDEMPHRNVFTYNTMISSYLNSNNLKEAKCIFDAASERDSVTYNTMLLGYAKSNGYDHLAFSLFNEMLPRVDEFSLTTMLKLGARMELVHLIPQLHCIIAKSGNDDSLFVTSSLIDTYSKCGCFQDAFDTYKTHASGGNRVVRNAVIAACCRRGEMETALSIFGDDVELNDTVSWNTVVSGYLHCGRVEEAMNLWRLMIKNKVRWNEQSFVHLLATCSLAICREAHARVLKNGMLLNTVVEGAIVDGYCKCGSMKYAESLALRSRSFNSFLAASMIVGFSAKGEASKSRRIFDSLEKREKNVVVWTAFLTCLAKSLEYDSLFTYFASFTAEVQSPPDPPILLILLTACSSLADMRFGKQIHGYVTRFQICNSKVSSAMIDMYFKSGAPAPARALFGSVADKDLVIYNIMISCYAHHGFADEAMDLFGEILRKKIAPDEVTFVAILSVCRHTGWIELGEKLFKSMSEIHGIEPQSNHYACVIDMYGRAKRLGEAAEFMERVPVEKRDGAVLGALLDACRLSGDAEVARCVEEMAVQAEEAKGSRYVLAANIYGAKGNWLEMKRVRKKMKENRAKKLAGCSWIDVGRAVNVFISGQLIHPKAVHIHSVLHADISSYFTNSICNIIYIL